MCTKITYYISFYDLRKICIANNLYTYGTCDEYDAMFDFVDNNDMCEENVIKLANDIYEHSDGTHQRARILEGLLNIRRAVVE